MFEGLAPDLGFRLLLAVVGVALALVVFAVVLHFLKKRNSPLFIKGGRAREHRLHVLDAAAVDAKRRLVLIRRDDTEHLIMIGGPTDIVIETGICQRTGTSKPENLEAQRTRQEATEPEPHFTNPRPTERATHPGDRPSAAPERPAAAETVPPRAPTAPVSAAAAILYGADESRAPASRGTASGQAAAALQRRTAEQDPALASQAESVLDMARNRVLSPQNPGGDPANAERVRQEVLRAEQARQEAARAEAQRVEAQRAEARRQEAVKAEERARQEQLRQESARREAMERAEAARREAERREQAEAARKQVAPSNERLASDFAQLLETELEAGGIFGEMPNVELRGETRPATSQAGLVPNRAPLTGASATQSAEQDMVRRLAEANLEKKSDKD